MALITGNTFPVKDQLRALGGRWLPAQRAWLVPDAYAQKARDLVDLVAVLPDRAPGHSTRTCRICGGRINYGSYCGKCEYSR